MHNSFRSQLPDDVVPVRSSKVDFPERMGGKNAHAEESIVIYAKENGWGLVDIAASKRVCPEVCAPLIRSVFPNANIITPLR